jgi:hypothetical protein
MKKTVQIVTIPLNKEGWGKGDICSHTLTSIDKKYLIAANDNPDGENGRAQQLLVLSDDEIQEGDLVYNTLSNEIYNLFGIYRKYPVNPEFIFKIVASYPQLEGTLPISKETVQAWIDSGTPGEGSVENHPYLIRNGDNTVFDDFNVDTQGNLLLEFGEKIELKEIGEKLKDRILFPDALEHAKDYLSKVVKPSIPTDEEILKKSLEHSNNLYNSDDKCKDNILSEHQLWENCLRDYEAGYKQALKDLGYE